MVRLALNAVDRRAVADMFVVRRSPAQKPVAAAPTLAEEA